MTVRLLEPSLLPPLKIALATNASERAAAIAKTIRTDGATIAAEMLIDAVRGNASKAPTNH